jgi:hypothetical protein
MNPMQLAVQQATAGLPRYKKGLRAEKIKVGRVRKYRSRISPARWSREKMMADIRRTFGDGPPFTVRQFLEAIMPEGVDYDTAYERIRTLCREGRLFRVGEQGLRAFYSTSPERMPDSGLRAVDKILQRAGGKPFTIDDVIREGESRNAFRTALGQGMKEGRVVRIRKGKPYVFRKSAVQAIWQEVTP